MKLVETDHVREHAASDLRYVSVLDDGGVTLSWGKVRTVETRYDRAWLKTLVFGGVGTKVEYRRRGCVRFLLDTVMEKQPEEGWALAMLHPFSFAYYQQFGFERIADHRVLEIPISALNFVERASRLREADPANDAPIRPRCSSGMSRISLSSCFSR